MEMNLLELNFFIPCMASHNKPSWGLDKLAISIRAMLMFLSLAHLVINS